MNDNDNTVKTGSGGATRRFFTRRNGVFIAILAGVLILAAATGVGVRMWLNKDTGSVVTTGEGASLPKQIVDIQDQRLQGNAAEADKNIESALNDSNTSKEDRYFLYIQKGAGLFEQQKFAEAAEAYNQAVAIKATSEAYVLLGDTYTAADQKDKAIEAYKKAIPLLTGPIAEDDKASLENKIRKLGGSV